MKAEAIQPVYDIPWSLETEHCHHGMPLSNGVFGALVWFQEQTIMMTLNRADYWDHRGGTIWSEACTYDNLKGLLQNGDFEGARKLYPITIVNGKEKRPTRLAMGRFEVKLRPGVRIVSATLHLRKGEVSVRCVQDGTERTIRITVAHEHPILIAAADAGLIEAVLAKPSYEFEKVRAYFDDFGIPPHRSVNGPEMKGWVQELPEDPACAVLSVQTEACIRIAAEYGGTAEVAVDAAMRHLDQLEPLGYDDAASGTRGVWSALWSKAADIALPDREITAMYYLGVYRMLGNSMPGRIAPTLQGPWAEEYRNPPWSCDYHFNINVQECLWPAYGANLLECLQPLFDLIDGWKPTLAINAKRFVGIDDGYMLGHSVDDRGRPVGGMWTGTIDQANTSWVAQMMWQFAKYAGDDRYMLEEVYPFMRRTLNVFHAMMEKDGDVYKLPVSVSPEYGGSNPEALGSNSTFFLVNVRFLCEKLLELTEQYGLDAEYGAFVQVIWEKLPPYTAGPRQHQEFGNKPGFELYLWEGQPLSECHRHHSHLAGIYPFDTMDLSEADQCEIIENSYRTWVDKGMGRWAGWSMPWASILHNRLGRPDMALLSLHLLKDVFMMHGYTTRHNANYDGFSQFIGGETMQVEASIAAAAAVLEMYVQCVRGTIRVFTGVARRFKDASFAGIRAEGAFLLSGMKADGAVRSVTVFSERSETLRLANPFTGKAAIRRDGDTSAVTEEVVIELQLFAGETVVLTAVEAEVASDNLILKTREAEK